MSAPGVCFASQMTNLLSVVSCETDKNKTLRDFSGFKIDLSFSIKKNSTVSCSGYAIENGGVMLFQSCLAKLLAGFF